MIESTTWGSLALASFLLAFSIWQILESRKTLLKNNPQRLENSQCKNKNRSQNQSPKGGDHSFTLRQAWRRLQMSGLFGIAAFAMIAGASLPPQSYPRLFLASWGITLIFLVWGILLALVDCVDMKIYYSGLLHQRDAERIGLEYLLKKHQEQKDSREKDPKERESK